MIPAQFRVIVTKRPKLACRACAGTVVQAPAPPRLIEGGLPTEALVAHVLVSRYADHLPLYRQAQIMARQGIELERSTLASWVGYAAAEIAPAGAAQAAAPWSAGCARSCSPRRGCSPTRPPCRCSTLAAAGPRPATCGRSHAMIGPGAGRIRRRWSTATPRAGGSGTPTRCWAATAASCSATATPPTRSWLIPCGASMAMQLSHSCSVGPTCAGASTTWPRPARPRSRPRHSSASQRCIGSRPRSAAKRRRRDRRYVRRTAGRS